MSITDKLNDLKLAKQDIKSAIQEKGVTPTGGLSTYADAIRDIQTGGGEGGTVALPVGTKLGYSTFTEAPFFDMSGYTDMSQMFYNCKKLETVPLYDTGNATNMASMFYGCSGLKDVPHFDTSNVTSMWQMFYNCKSLKNAPYFDTSNVTNMSYMFEGCEYLETVPLYDTSNVTNMGWMFYNCRNLETIPQFNTSNVTDMNVTFRYCSSLKEIPLLDTNKLSSGISLVGCNNLTDLGGFKNLSTNLDLYSCYKLTHESLMNVINNLATVTETKEIKLNQISIDKLSAEEKAIATNKGWTITTA